MNPSPKVSLFSKLADTISAFGSWVEGTWMGWGVFIGFLLASSFFTIQDNKINAPVQSPTQQAYPEPEWTAWPALELQPDEEEAKLIMPFLQARPGLQTAMEDWFRLHGDTVNDYVDFLSEKPSPDLSFNIPRQFQCKKDEKNNVCAKNPYDLYQVACSYQGCTYFLCRHNQNQCVYVIVGMMDENLRWQVICYSPDQMNLEDRFPFCSYLRREWDLR